MSTNYTSKSGNLKYTYVNGLVHATYYDIKQAGTHEYLDFSSKVGDTMRDTKTGKLLLDISNMKNFDISTRSAVVKNLPEILFNKMPYFVIAIIKGSNLFENLATQTALKMAIPLSKKFLNGKMFDTEKEATEWLKNFPVPEEFLNKWT